MSVKRGRPPKNPIILDNIPITNDDNYTSEKPAKKQRIYKSKLNNNETIPLFPQQTPLLLDQTPLFPQPILSEERQTILGKLVPNNPNVQKYDTISKLLLEKIKQREQEIGSLFTQPVRSWGIFIIDQNGNIKNANDEVKLSLGSDALVVEAKNGTPSQTIAKAYQTSCMIVDYLKSSGQPKQEFCNWEIIAKTPREILSKQQDNIDGKIFEALQSIINSKMSPLEKQIFKLSIGANTLVKSASDAGQNSNAQEYMACSIIDLKQKGQMKSISSNNLNSIGSFFNYKDIIGMANISSDKLSILSSIASTKIFENANDHTDGIFDTFCPRKGEGGREAINLVSAVVWAVARLLANEGRISKRFPEIIQYLNQTTTNFGVEYIEAYRDPGSNLLDYIVPSSSIQFFSHDMWNAYSSYFREIYSCIQTIKNEPKLDFCVDIEESLNFIEEKCKSLFLNRKLKEDTEYHLNELLNLNNAYNAYYTLQANMNESVAEEYAYDNTFKFIRRMLRCYSNYYMKLLSILDNKSVDLVNFIFDELNSEEEIRIDTKYLQIAKTWYSHSGLNQYMKMDDDQIANSILKKSQQTLTFMCIDSGDGHDFPSDKLIETLPEKLWGFGSNESDKLNSDGKKIDEATLVIRLMRKLGCVSIVSTETPKGPMTISICSQNPDRNLLTSSTTYSGIPIYKIFTGLEPKCNFTGLNIDYTSIMQVSTINPLYMISTIDNTIDIMQQFMQGTTTLRFVTPSTLYDLAAPTRGCFIETGKESTIFYEELINDRSGDKLALAFFTYNPNKDAKNTLELENLACLKKYVASHDFYTPELLADFFNTPEYSKSIIFRQMIDQFVSGSKSAGIGDRGASANITLRLCTSLLDKYYKEPNSVIKILLSNPNVSQECGDILEEFKNLFENIDAYRRATIQTGSKKVPQVKEKEYKLQSIIFIKSLKNKIGDSYIKYLSKKISENCLRIPLKILECLVSLLPSNISISQSTSNFETENEVARIVKERADIIQSFAMLGNRQFYPSQSSSLSLSNDIARGVVSSEINENEVVSTLFNNITNDEKAIEYVVEDFANYLGITEIGKKCLIKQISQKYYQKLQGSIEEKIENLKNHLGSIIDKYAGVGLLNIGNQNIMEVGGYRKKTRRRNKLYNKKTRKIRKQNNKKKQKKYTRTYKLKKGKNTRKRGKK